MMSSVCRFTMAAIFALGAAHGMRDWALYTAQVVEYRIMPEWLARFASRVLPPLQLGTAMLLPMSGTACLPGLGLMLVFTLAIAVNVARGRTDIDCGCGGATGQTLSWSLVIRNLALCALLILGWAAPAAVPADAAALTTTIGATMFLVALYFAVNQLLANAQALAVGRAA